MAFRLSLVIPTLNEVASLGTALGLLQPLRKAGHEIIVVDGGSNDSTLTVANGMADQLLTVTPPSRARQMNAGAAAATNDILLFLHADTAFQPSLVDSIGAAFAGGKRWGRFDVRLSGERPMLRLIARLMNWRSCLSGIATGDQGIFVERQLFDAVGGFPEQPLMEDIELSRRLRRWQWPACLRGPLVTSSRRWEHYGVLRTILLMWRLRLAYFFGASPEVLNHRYRASDSR